jgi:hypothetical protein
MGRLDPITLAVQDADIHFARMQIDTTVVLVLLSIESHCLASFHAGKCLLAVTAVYLSIDKGATSRNFPGENGP